ncbi:SDR family NAD(P)-dependent oxidoreductase [Solihabitans fulvus]|uniref:SDR family NAD(P)-dependent oxidoreductase n=1 Tax=Solihabitans fulvus TaxID=1892852 RepID=A0A5B2WL32_9PSEU|nr:SDR family oxidoreductase [Solihabitans fulvus]KAA2251450.1 SDR family NAD(P)-dependent oxidoreductase [Solihabitans fulvus]
MSKPLGDKVAVVTGATRGAGRAIAVELGAAGATVFVGGRTSGEHRSWMDRSETIEETVELVDAAGGRGIALRCDFTVVEDVDALRDRIESEVDGRLDVLVDNAWGGNPLTEFGKPIWEQDLDKGLRMWRNGVESHFVALNRLLPLLVRRPGGLLVEVTDGDGDQPYSTSLFYDAVKDTLRMFGRRLAEELKPFGGTAVALTPGFLRSEEMLDILGVTEQNWRDAEDPNYAMSETPNYVGRAVVALATDPDVARWSGRTLSSWGLMREYGFTDLDGTRPDWGRWFDEVLLAGVDPATADPGEYR